MQSNRWLIACLTPVLIVSAAPLSARADICSYVDAPVALEGVDFRYPVFSLNDAQTEEIINAHVSEHAYRLFADWYQWPAGSYAEGGVLRVAVDEEQNVLSILTSVFFDIAGAAHPYTLLYAENYSLDDGSPLYLMDFLEPEHLLDVLREGRFDSPQENDPLFAEQKSYLLAQNEDSLSALIRDSELMWLPGESLLVVLPTIHALGDYAVLSIKKSDLI